MTIKNGIGDCSKANLLSLHDRGEAMFESMVGALAEALGVGSGRRLLVSPMPGELG